MPPPFICRAQKPNITIGRDEEEILDGMLFLLAAVVERLFIWIAWPVYRSFGAIMKKKPVPSAFATGALSAGWMSAVRDGRTPTVANA